MASRAWARYERMLDEYPLLARSLTAGTIAGCAEGASQAIASALSSLRKRDSRRRRPTSTSSFEARRVAMWFLYGALFSGPAGHLWQKLLASFFASSSPPSKAAAGKEKREEEESEADDDRAVKKDDADDKSKSKELVLRVAADSFLYGPFCNAVAIAFIALALERKKSASVPGQVRSTLPSLQLRAWRFWPLASLVAYTRVPPKMRVPFFNACGFLWGVILITASKKKK